MEQLGSKAGRDRTAELWPWLQEGASPASCSLLKRMDNGILKTSKYGRLYRVEWCSCLMDAAFAH